MSRHIVALAARTAFVAICALPCVAPAWAQRSGAPPRPKGAVADTNDAQAYFDYGLSVFEQAPHNAVAAFYWASRLNPGMADAFYARRAATVIADPSLRKLYIDGGRRAQDSKQLRALDSPYLRALKMNPLLYRRLDRRLITAHIVEETQRELRRSGSDVSRSELDFVVEQWLREAGPGLRARARLVVGRRASVLS